MNGYLLTGVRIFIFSTMQMFIFLLEMGIVGVAIVVINSGLSTLDISS